MHQSRPTVGIRYNGHTPRFPEYPDLVISDPTVAKNMPGGWSDPGEIQGMGLSKLWKAIGTLEKVIRQAKREASRSSLLLRRLGYRSCLASRIGDIIYLLRDLRKNVVPWFYGLTIERVQPCYGQLLKTVLELAYVLNGSTPVGANYVLKAQSTSMKTQMVYNLHLCASELKLLAAALDFRIDARKRDQTDHMASQLIRAMRAWEDKLIQGE